MGWKMLSVTLGYKFATALPGRLGCGSLSFSWRYLNSPHWAGSAPTPHIFKECHCVFCSGDQVVFNIALGMKVVKGASEISTSFQLMPAWPLSKLRTTPETNLPDSS